MKKLVLGLIAATTIALTAAPALAQIDFFAGPGGVGIQFGARYGYYYSYPYGYGYAPGWRWHQYHYHHW